jgi:hypothetical protein
MRSESPRVRLRNADVVAVGVLLVVTMGLAGHALGQAAAHEAGTPAPARFGWHDLLPQAWAPSAGGVVMPPEPAAATASPMSTG